MSYKNIIPDNNLKITSVSYSDGWNITMTGTGWPWMMKTAKIVCPDCKTLNLYVNGNYIKGGKRYKCLNANCKTVTFIIK